MGSLHPKRIRTVLVLITLACASALVPQLTRIHIASAAAGAGSTTIQCPAPFGGSPVILPVPPTGTTGTSTAGLSVSPTGTSAAVVAQSCTPLSSTVAAATGSTLAIAICGRVTAVSSSSVTVSGIIIPIPSGYTAPSYVTVGGVIYIVFLYPGGQLVEISPGNCTVPLQATVVRWDGSGRQRVGRGYAD